MPLTDILNLCSKLTIKRVWNIFLVYGSFYWSRVFKSPTHAGLPISVSIEPTTSCNLRCPECPSGLRSFTRPTGMLQKELFEKTINELSPSLLYLTFYFQGEPYLNPEFLNMVKYASGKKIYTATSTNAHYLTDENARKTIESGLDRLIISIDGTTQETYEQYRIGGNIEKVLEGTKNIVKWKKQLNSSTPHIIFQYLVVQPNEHQIEDAKQLAIDMGVDEIKFKTAQIYDYQNGSPLIPTIDYYSRYKRNENGTFSVKNKLLNQCWKMWHSCVITWDGLVVPCCFDKDAEHRLGNVETTSFKKIWNDELYKSFRSKLFRSRSEIEICKNCTEGTKVWG